MRHRHTTPFEMCEIKYHVKLPIFVARQWIRHRTANVNEYSARYSVLEDEFYVPAPEHVASQASSNRQGVQALGAEGGAVAQETVRANAERAYAIILRCSIRTRGAPVGQARGPGARARPHRAAAQHLYRGCWDDLHNLLHFVALRMIHRPVRDPRHAEVLRRRSALGAATCAAFGDYRSTPLLSGKRSRRCAAARGQDVSQADGSLSTREWARAAAGMMRTDPGKAAGVYRHQMLAR
jgi:thymidylate synthase (FAD)